jgi:hypothetical protein
MDPISKVAIIMRQTDYTEEAALTMLNNFNGDHIKVIKAYLGIAEKKAPAVKSLNQEMYRQMRVTLNESIKTYNQQQEEKLKTELTNHSS